MKGIGDLSEALFAQIEKLNNCEGEKLEAEIGRSNAIGNVAKLVIESHSLQLDAIKLVAEHVGMTNTNDVDKLIGRTIESTPQKVKRIG